MDEIEAGFSQLVAKIEEQSKSTEKNSTKITEHDAVLLTRMAELSRSVIRIIGLNMLKRGKQDGKGELFDTSFYPEKMIVLAKTDPLKYRPDDVTKKVDDQFCVLSEDGKFYELMYSSDGVSVDSFLQPLSGREVIDIYHYEAMFMLYRALHDYLKNQEELLKSLEITLNFIFASGQP
ncbi:MAG TPA: hypothetical protein VMS89_07085 [Methanoregulaceae archaeon]|nr:hypothetical protein [Methanoregulaceae archaeon]